MKSRIFATLAAVAVLAIGVAGPAYSQPYTGALSANSAAPGGSVEYSSDQTGEPGGTSGTYSLTGDPSNALGGSAVDLAADVTHSVEVGSHGELAFTVTLPKDAKPGTVYTLDVTAGTFADTHTITIVGVPDSANVSNLTWLWIVLLVAALIVLALIIVVARRRRSTPTDSAAA
ncbi:MAG TPA: hypothetical protein VNT53_02425 [Pseudolysinimonas sp.]|nr:hypothetical protein [Pseudolysinimonas sp.]